MISMTCDPRRETVRFVWRNASFRFRCFGFAGAQNERHRRLGVQIETLQSLPELVEGTLRWWARTRAAWKFLASKSCAKAQLSL
jgi:hypothetical protein